MTYEELVEKVREVYGQADASGVEGHVAYQFNITGEGEGAFYLEIADGNIHIEPFEYYDRDVLFTTTADTLIKIGLGELDAVDAFTTGKLNVEGNFDKALLLNTLSSSVKDKIKEAAGSSEKAKTEAKTEPTSKTQTDGKKWPNRKKKRR